MSAAYQTEGRSGRVLKNLLFMHTILHNIKHIATSFSPFKRLSGLLLRFDEVLPLDLVWSPNNCVSKSDFLFCFPLFRSNRGSSLSESELTVFDVLVRGAKSENCSLNKHFKK